MTTTPTTITHERTALSGPTASTRQIVTGLGIVAPNGIGIEQYWSATLAGHSAIQELTRFDTTPYRAKLAAVTEIDAAAHLPGRLLPQTDLMTRLALVASDAALADAGVDPKQLPPYAVGVFTGSSAGGFDFVQRELEALWSKGPEFVSAYQAFAWFYPVNSGQISIRHNTRGPGGAVVADGAGGLDAIAKARGHVRGGTAVMLTGAVDGSLCPWSWICLEGSGRLTGQRDPRRGYLPFDTAASGHVPGEGGAILVLEDEESARRRDAPRLYGEVAGHAATFDGREGAAAGGGLRRAIEGALADARTEASEIDVVFADAAAVPELDAAEARVLAEVFGPRGVPVAAPKTMTGRSQAATGPLDVAAALLSLRDNVIPPAVNVDSPAYPALLDLVLGQPREVRLDRALVLARGQGGFNSAVVVRRVR